MSPVTSSVSPITYPLPACVTASIVYVVPPFEIVNCAFRPAGVAIVPLTPV